MDTNSTNALDFSFAADEWDDMLEITLNEQDLTEFFSDAPSPAQATEQYCAELERRLSDLYGHLTFVGLGVRDEYIVDGEFDGPDHDAAALVIEDVMDQMNNDWSWLTAA